MDLVALVFAVGIYKYPFSGKGTKIENSNSEKKIDSTEEKITSPSEVEEKDSTVTSSPSKPGIKENNDTQKKQKQIGGGKPKSASSSSTATNNKPASTTTYNNNKTKDVEEADPSSTIPTIVTEPETKPINDNTK